MTFGGGGTKIQSTAKIEINRTQNPMTNAKGL
jgi:hypothetical protein